MSFVNYKSMQRDLEIDLLRTFVAVASHTNFTRAAAAVGRTQSAVSLQIRRLEQIVGRSVFERTRQSVEITRTGEALLVYANRILKTNDEAISLFRQPDAAGLMRIGTPDDYATCLLPPILAQFSQRYPLIRIEVTCDNGCDLLQMQKKGQLDLVVATHPLNDVSGQAVRREPLHWVAAPGFVDNPDAPLPLVLYQQGCVCRELALRALNKVDRQWHIAYSTRSIALIESAVRNGSGVSVMEQSTIPDHLRIIDGNAGFPALPEVVISVHQNPGNVPPHIALTAEFLLAELARR
ncbi:MAG: LysR family transcriptional regulator [Hyphomicrobiales bacterium]|nr:LysR family transcriptional regulator [Hyphomicrobiales bacterium]MCP4998535.1 LysR family transcriptional regulator [Hyphomicrobiales bacterium]